MIDRLGLISRGMIAGDDAATAGGLRRGGRFVAVAEAPDEAVRRRTRCDGGTGG